MREKILIIGGAGYIGTSLTEKLVREGHEVTVYDNLTYGPNPLKRLDLMLCGASLIDALQADLTKNHRGSRHYRFIDGDTRDQEGIKAVIGNGYKYVFHFGELVGISACEANSENTRAINYVGTRNVVDGVLDSPHPPRLIWNSSSSVYHQSSDGACFRENSQLPEFGSLDQYCQNKILAERYILEQSEKSSGFEFIVLRPATVGGLSPRMRIELLPNHIAYSLSLTGRFALANSGDCRAVMDIEDLTNFYVSLIGANNWQNGVYNIGCLNQSKREYVSQICRLVGLNQDKAIVNVSEAGDLRNLTISSDLLGETYGFSPERGLDQMIPPLVGLLRANQTVFASRSRNPLVVDSEFSNTPPEKFRELLPK